MSESVLAPEYGEEIFGVPTEAIARVASAAGSIAAGFLPKVGLLVDTVDPSDTVRLLAEGFPLLADVRYNREVDPKRAQAYLDRVRVAGAGIRADVQRSIPIFLGPLDRVLRAISADGITGYTFADHVHEALDDPATKGAARGVLDYLDTLDQFSSPSGQLRDEIATLRVRVAGQPGHSVDASKVARNLRTVADQLLSGQPPEPGSQTRLLGTIATQIGAGLRPERLATARARFDKLSDQMIGAAAPAVVQAIDRALTHGQRTKVRRNITGVVAGVASALPIVGEKNGRKLAAVAHIEPLLSGLFDMLPANQQELADTRAQISEFFLAE